jgi:hypothetical protein
MESEFVSGEELIIVRRSFSVFSFMVLVGDVDGFDRE